MPFGDFEESVESGAPVELYLFSYSGGTFRYTSADADIDFQSATYTQTALSRSQVDDSSDVLKSSMNITVPEDFAVARLFEVAPPSDVVTVTIYRMHTTNPGDYATIWIGRVLNAVWSVGSSVISCESVFTRMKTPGLRRIFSRNCPHLLYGPACRAQETLFQEVAVLNGLESAGFDVTSPSFSAHPDGYFAGGKLSFEASPGVVERRGIRDHVGDTVTMTHPIASLLATSVVTVAPGCARTRDVCVATFNNVVNFGGFPFIPPRNPFGGGSVF